MVDSIVRTFFNKYLQSFFEREYKQTHICIVVLLQLLLLLLIALPEGALEVSFADGLILHDLRVRPKGVNERLAVRFLTV